jgi:hypothetical protein
MKNYRNILSVSAFAVEIISIYVLLFRPSNIHACACSCSVFDVGAGSMYPEHAGGMAYLEYNFQDQNQNWRGDSRASSDDNSDKQIKTHFVTAGLNYIFNRSWGMDVQLPYANRSFTTIGGASGSDLVSQNWGGIGDIRLKGIYTGLSGDLSTGLEFGVKLPTGSYTHNDTFGDIDRDTQIGSGSTDLLMGAFHRYHLTSDGAWNGFVQGGLQIPFLTREGYRPGIEFNAAAGLYYKGWTIRGVKLRPVGQVIYSGRTSDSGSAAADPVASGYHRVLLSPGLEVDVHPLRFYADVELPVYEHVTGNQLVAPIQFKLVAGYMF